MTAPAFTRRPAAIGLIGLVVCLVLVLLAMNAGRLPVIGEGGRTLQADFTDASGIESGDPVEVAGVQVGKVTGLAMGRGHIRISFTVPDELAVGTRTRVAIRVGSLLGSKYLDVVPGGPGRQDDAIPVSRTTSAYDVTTALADLTETVDPIDTAALEQALTAVGTTFRGAGPDVQASVRGLSRLSRTIAARDTEVSRLLRRSSTLATSLNGSRADIAALVESAGTLLAELDGRREALSGLITHTRELAVQLRGLVTDNRSTLTPALASLSRVTEQLEKRQDDLRATLRAVARFSRVFVNTIGSGPWFDSYIANLPDSFTVEED